MRTFAKAALRRLMLATGRHWARPALTGRGTVQDLFYWTRENGLDTVVMLNNFYSAFLPTRDTTTGGTVLVYGSDGAPLGEKRVRVGHLEGVRLHVSELLREFGAAGRHSMFGTLAAILDIPDTVVQALAPVEGPFYFWHRSYIGYTTPQGQIAFVHDVDTALTMKRGASAARRWYGRPRPRDWTPEMPVNLTDYARLDVVLLNRSRREAALRLAVADVHERERHFSGRMAPNGALRFTLSADDLADLEPRDLRLLVRGIPTAYGRPILFKHFRNGTISVSHS